MARGKKYHKALGLLKTETAYNIDEATKLLEKTNKVNFDTTVEIHLNLNIDYNYN